jgi:hypothetical protein
MSTDASYQNWNNNAGMNNSGVNDTLFDASHGRHVRTQVLLYNADVDINRGRVCAGVLADGSIADNKKILGSLTSGGGNPFDHCDIHEHKVSWYMNDQRYALGSDQWVENRVQIIQSITGIEIPQSVKTQEQFSDLFTPAGCPAYKHFVNRAGQPDTGVATMVAGSWDVWNNGHDVWMPGDQIVARIPYMDRELREKEAALLPSDREHPPGRNEAILEVLTFEKSHDFLKDGLTKSFRMDPNEDARKWSFTKLLPASDEALGSIERGVISLRAAFTLHTLNVISWLRLQGFMPTTGEAVPVARTFDLASFRDPSQLAKEQTNLNQLLAAQHDGKMSLGNEIKWWAAKLGLLGPATPAGFEPWDDLVDVPLGMTLYPLINAPNLQKFFSLGRFFHEDQLADSRADTRIGSGTNLVRSFNMQSHTGSLLYAQRSYGKDVFATINFAYERQRSRVVFTAMELTPPTHIGLIWN